MGQGPSGAGRGQIHLGQVPRVHAVTDASVAALPDLATRSAALAISRLVALHARAPGWDAKPLLALGRSLLDAAAAHGSPVLVNDRVDVARLIGASGVHLPEEGLPIPTVRALLGPGPLIGRSTHSAAAARTAAEEGADYVFLGPIWGTASHPGRAPLGPREIERAAGIRVIAIGGVTPERAARCRDAGAWGVAAVSALWWAHDPGSAVRAMLLPFGREPDPHYAERPGAAGQR
ncbi:MAG TPA: thiamine phosphate synthase [Gemmatimonadales bacterium]